MATLHSIIGGHAHFTIATITQKVIVYVPAERADTLPLFHLYPICTLWVCHLVPNPAHCRGEVNYRREGGSSPAQAVMGLLLVGMDARNYALKIQFQSYAFA